MVDGGALAFMFHPDRVRTVIRLMRMNAGLTEAQAAAAVGVSTVTYMRFEHGTSEMSVPQLIALLAACKYTLVALAEQSKNFPQGGTQR